MRSSGNEIGRFDIPFEVYDIRNGISQDLTTFVGSECQWCIYLTTDKDPIYDVGGRLWTDPHPIKVTRNVLSRGSNEDRGVGFYNVDTLHLTINSIDILPFIPTILNFPDVHSKDRVIYEGQVFRPTAVQPRGVIGLEYALLSIELLQIHPEEMVNDEQFQAYAL